MFCHWHPTKQPFFYRNLTKILQNICLFSYFFSIFVCLFLTFICCIIHKFPCANLDFWLVSNGNFVKTKDDFLCRKHSKSSYKFDENLREKITKNTENLLIFHGLERKIVSYSVPWDCHWKPILIKEIWWVLNNFWWFLAANYTDYFVCFLRYFSQSLALNLLIFYEMWWLSALEKHGISMGFLNIYIYI